MWCLSSIRIMAEPNKTKIEDKQKSELSSGSKKTIQTTKKNTDESVRRLLEDINLKLLAAINNLFQEDMVKTVNVRGSEVRIKSIKIQDGGEEIKVSLWRELSDKNLMGQYVRIANVVVNIYKEEVSLSTTGKTAIEVTIMLLLQASRHQGSILFRNGGKQCMANSVQALARSFSIPPSKWTKDTMDEILMKGDQLYDEVKLPFNYKYWSSDDVPSSLNELTIYKEQPLHGVLGTPVGSFEKPFYCINNALNEVLKTDNAYCIFTVGKSDPSYTCALMKIGKCFYCFDPHSRDKLGMPTAEGFATLKEFDTMESLESFIFRLSDLLFNAIIDIPFEICKMTFSNLDIRTDIRTDISSDISSDISEFEGFSDDSDAECVATSKLYAANEQVNKLQYNSFSDISDVSSISVDSADLNETLLDEALIEVNNSAHFMSSFNANVFMHCSSPKININKSNDIESQLNEGLIGESNDSESQLNEGLIGESNDNESQLNEGLIGESNDIESQLNEGLIGESNDSESQLNEGLIGESNDIESQLNEGLIGESNDIESQLNEGLIGESNDIESQLNEGLIGESNDIESQLNEGLIGESNDIESQLNEGLIGESNDSESQLNEGLIGESNDSESQLNEGLIGESNDIESQLNEGLIGESNDSESQLNEGLIGESNDSESQLNEGLIGESNDSESQLNEGLIGESNDIESQLNEGLIGESNDCENEDMRESGTDDEDNVPLINFVRNRQYEKQNQNVNTNHEETPLIGIRSTQVNEDTSSSLSSISQRGRKRVKNIEQWKRNVAKRRRNEGKEYLTRTGKIRNERSIKPGCGQKCRFKCHDKIDLDKRQNLLHYFWALGDINHQRNFILRYTNMKEKQIRKGQSDRRKNSCYYTLPLKKEEPSKIVKVCKTFFLHTLSISDRYIFTSHKLSKTGYCDDKRGKHNNRPNKTTSEQLKQVHTHIQSFPTVESHYCRKDSQKLYLSSELNLTKMFFLYKEACVSNGQSPVSISVYRRIFDNEYNISFHKPLKDQCDLCVAFNNSTQEHQNAMKSDIEIHITNKNLVREAKENDKIIYKNDQITVCACYDLQEILLTPKSFESSLYYRRRLNTFNFSIYNLVNRDGFCFVWNESIANRGACEIASCVYDFIKQYALQGKKKFIFYTDNCSAQNKNKFLLTMYWYCLRKFQLTSITHKYLEKGHTQNENDSVHSTIESASKHVKVYTTAQWASIIRMARREQPYQVKEMSLNDFYDFKEITCHMKNFEVNEDGHKVIWNKIKALYLSSTEPDCFLYKTMHNGEEMKVNIFKRLRSDPPNPNLLKLRQLREDGVEISKEKFADLLYLCKMQIIPPVHHAFYLLLPHKID